MLFEEVRATCDFDHLRVLWNRVFLHEDIHILNRRYEDAQMCELTAHQTNVHAAVKLGFVCAVLVRMAEVSGSTSRTDMMELLGEAVACVEVIRSTTRSAEAQAIADPDNVLPIAIS